MSNFSIKQFDTIIPQGPANGADKNQRLSEDGKADREYTLAAPVAAHLGLNFPQAPFSANKQFFRDTVSRMGLEDSPRQLLIQSLVDKRNREGLTLNELMLGAALLEQEVEVLAQQRYREILLKGPAVEEVFKGTTGNLVDSFVSFQNAASRQILTSQQWTVYSPPSTPESKVLNDHQWALRGLEWALELQRSFKAELNQLEQEYISRGWQAPSPWLGTSIHLAIQDLDQASFECLSPETAVLGLDAAEQFRMANPDVFDPALRQPDIQQANPYTSEAVLPYEDPSFSLKADYQDLSPAEQKRYSMDYTAYKIRSFEQKMRNRLVAIAEESFDNTAGAVLSLTEDRGLGANANACREQLDKFADFLQVRCGIGDGEILDSNAKASALIGRYQEALAAFKEIEELRWHQGSVKDFQATYAARTAKLSQILQKMSIEGIAFQGAQESWTKLLVNTASTLSAVSAAIVAVPTGLSLPAALAAGAAVGALAGGVSKVTLNAHDSLMNNREYTSRNALWDMGTGSAFGALAGGLGTLELAIAKILAERAASALAAPLLSSARVAYLGRRTALSAGMGFIEEASANGLDAALSGGSFGQVSQAALLGGAFGFALNPLAQGSFAGIGRGARVLQRGAQRVENGARNLAHYAMRTFNDTADSLLGVLDDPLTRRPLAWATPGSEGMFRLPPSANMAVPDPVEPRIFMAAGESAGMGARTSFGFDDSRTNAGSIGKTPPVVLNEAQLVDQLTKANSRMRELNKEWNTLHRQLVEIGYEQQACQRQRGIYRRTRTTYQGAAPVHPKNLNNVGETIDELSQRLRTVQGDVESVRQQTRALEMRAEELGVDWQKVKEAADARAINGIANAREIYNKLLNSRSAERKAFLRDLAALSMDRDSASGVRSFLDLALKALKDEETFFKAMKTATSRDDVSAAVFKAQQSDVHPLDVYEAMLNHRSLQGSKKEIEREMARVTPQPPYYFLIRLR